MKKDFFPQGLSHSLAIDMMIFFVLWYVRVSLTVDIHISYAGQSLHLKRILDRYIKKLIPDYASLPAHHCSTCIECRVKISGVY